jgi:CheY-like chemotaxis protein
MEDAIQEGRRGMATESKTRHRLLAVDDDETIRTMLKDFFEGAGYAVDTAQDAGEALQRLSQDYDVILSDVMMPKVSGIDLLQQVRSKKPKALVFLITASPSLETLSAAKRYGAMAYFKKPLKLMEMEARIRGFLEASPGTLVDGRVLVVGQELHSRLADRLVRFQACACGSEEPAFLDAVNEQRPKAILADAGAPATPGLLRAYRRLGREANSFLLVSDEAALDAANELLFTQGAAACIPAAATREAIERCIKDAVDLRERQKLDQQGKVEEVTNKCMFAKAYRNGYYCLKQGACPNGAFQAGWISIDGKEHHKCAKRPLLVTSLDSVGFSTWTGRIDPTQALELRKQLMALVRERKQELIVDAQGLVAATYNLFEVLSDVYSELVKSHPDGVVHVINLTPAIQEEFRKAMINKGVRFYGVRMVDERSTFERWGTRFD